MPNAKPWWTSKTYWFNALMAALAVANEILVALDGLSQAGVDHPLIDSIRTGLMLAVVIGNIVLRTITTTPVRFAAPSANEGRT